MELQWYGQLFNEEWKQEQMYVLVLSFFRVTEIVEHISRRIVGVLFYRWGADRLG